MSIELPRAWKKVLADECAKDYYQELIKRTEYEYEQYTIYPPKDQIYAALSRLEPDEVKVVILGQDPYHEEGQAMGIAFGVPNGVKAPPSLRNICKEIEDEFGSSVIMDTELKNWSDSGVLLLNTSLIVRRGEAGSLSDIGFEKLTDGIIRYLASLDKPMVYMLWGKHSIKKSELIKNSRQLILTSAHPSPLSAYRGFFGCGHFIKANEYLQEHNLEPIDWVKL